MDMAEPINSNDPPDSERVVSVPMDGVETIDLVDFPKWTRRGTLVQSPEVKDNTK